MQQNKQIHAHKWNGYLWGGYGILEKGIRDMENRRRSAVGGPRHPCLKKVLKLRSAEKGFPAYWGQVSVLKTFLKYDLMPQKVKHKCFYIQIPQTFASEDRYLMSPPKSASIVYICCQSKWTSTSGEKVFYQYLWKYLIFLHTFLGIDRCDLNLYLKSKN